MVAEYVDLLMLHTAGGEEAEPRQPCLEQGGWQQCRKEAWDALLAAQDKGKARAVGVSNFAPEHIEQLVQATGQTPAANQIDVGRG